MQDDEFDTDAALEEIEEPISKQGDFGFLEGID